MLFAFGLNNYGQLGIGQDLELDESCTQEPTEVVMEDEDEVIVTAAGGEHHSLLLTQSGKVYAFGRGDSSQTGFTDKEPCFYPKKLIDDYFINEINCGSAFSLALARNDGTGNNLLVWGFGEQGQLGNQGVDVEEPEEVSFKGRVLLCAEGGGQHTVMLILPKPKDPNDE